MLAAGVLTFTCASASAALPQAGVFEPGRSLGGVSLGATERAVKRAWGPRVGICRHCRYRTLFFTYVPFAPQGAAAVFRRGRVVALFTLWSPIGWRTIDGIRVGDPLARVRSAYHPLERADCPGYYVLTLRKGTTLSSFYVLGGKVWGFGLSRAGAPLCP